MTNFQDAMRSMSKPAKIYQPTPETRSFYDKKYRVFLAMTNHQIEYRRMMGD